MAEALTLMWDDPDVITLFDYLKTSGTETQRREYESLLDYVDTITQQYNTILTELDTLKEKVGVFAGKKTPIAVMTENLETLATNAESKLENLKDSIISFTKNTLDSAKEKGLSALGSVFGFLHIKDGLQAMSDSLAKSVDSLKKAVTRVDNLEQHNREKVTTHESAETPQSTEGQALSLSDLFADTRLDFENLSQDELKSLYEKFLAIGMNNELTANENICLQSLVDEVSDLLPDRGENTAELEAEIEQGIEM